MKPDYNPFLQDFPETYRYFHPLYVGIVGADDFQEPLFRGAELFEVRLHKGTNKFHKPLFREAEVFQEPVIRWKSFRNERTHACRKRRLSGTADVINNHNH